MAIPPRRWVGYALLTTGLLLLFDTDTFLRTDWSPLHVPLSVPTELALAYLLAAGGIVTCLASTLIRMVGHCAPDALVKAGERFACESVEMRLRRRLPLKKQFSALPDKAVVGGPLMLLLLIPMFLLILPPTPRGIYVSVSPRRFRESSADCVAGHIVVTMKRHSKLTQLFLNGKEVNREELEPALKAELVRRANWEVFIEADDILDYAEPMYAVDVINTLHANPVILTPNLKEQIASDECPPPTMR